jgi:hypothetical protein
LVEETGVSGENHTDSDCPCGIFKLFLTIFQLYSPILNRVS